MRIVVIGGAGNFGARICRALANPAAGGMEVIAAGRNAEDRAGSAKLDMNAVGFADRLRQLSPQIVIHCAGPFQGQDYRVAQAAIAAGAHYIDLSDGREFVARFAEELNADAVEAGVLAVSGASTLPALSSAVVDEFAQQFHQIEDIRIAIAPGQCAPRGAATMAAVFSYAGKSFNWLHDGKWVAAWGWQELQALHFAGLGTRWAAACDVPDLELFPARYVGVRTVQFRAALELRLQHSALWCMAGLRRSGIALPMERWAGLLDRAASLMDIFGSECGGMLIGIEGTGTDGERKRIEWHLTADHSHGPEIPCMPAILLARKLARDEVVLRGAYPCMGWLKLADFVPEFARWGITTRLVQSTPAGA